MKFDTVADVEAYLAFRRVTAAFTLNLQRITETAQRDFDAAMAEVQAARSPSEARTDGQT
jgi:hypothetical protein